MVRRGYNYEYIVKKRYEKKGIIAKLSIYSYCDFMVLLDNEDLLIECKTTIKNKWCPNRREVLQYKRLKTLEDALKQSNRPITTRIIYSIREAGIEKEYSLEKVKEKYFKKL